MYTAEKLFTTPSVSLTRGRILLIALLSGGDYHEVCFSIGYSFHVEKRNREFPVAVLPLPMQSRVVI